MIAVLCGWYSQGLVGRRLVEARETTVVFAAVLVGVLFLHLGIAAFSDAVVADPAPAAPAYAVDVGPGLPALPADVADGEKIVGQDAADVVIALRLTGDGFLAATLRDRRGAILPDEAVSEETMRVAARKAAAISRRWTADALRGIGAPPWQWSEPIVGYDEGTSPDGDDAVFQEPAGEGPAVAGSSLVDRMLDSMSWTLGRTDPLIAFLVGIRDLAAGAVLAGMVSMRILASRQAGHLEAAFVTQAGLEDVVTGRLVHVVLAALACVTAFALLPSVAPILLGDWDFGLSALPFRDVALVAVLMTAVAWVTLPALLFAHLRVRTPLQLAAASTAVFGGYALLIGAPASYVAGAFEPTCSGFGCGLPGLLSFMPLAGAYAAAKGVDVGSAAVWASVATWIAFGLVQYRVLYATTGRPHMLPIG